MKPRESTIPCFFRQSAQLPHAAELTPNNAETLRQIILKITFKAVTKLSTIPQGDPEFLEEITSRIAQSQTRAALAVSRELVLLYWSIGAEIVVREGAGLGAKVVDRLGQDLQQRFAGVEGFSPRNLRYMRSLAEAWPDPEMLPQRVALLPWAISVCCSTGSKTPPHATGTSARQYGKAGTRAPLDTGSSFITSLPRAAPEGHEQTGLKCELPKPPALSFRREMKAEAAIELMG